MSLFVRQMAGNVPQASPRTAGRQWREMETDQPPSWGWADADDYMLGSRTIQNGKFRGLGMLAPTYEGALGSSVPFVITGRISGTTLDSTGAALGSVKLIAFRTSDDAMVSPPGEFQSEPNGAYQVSVGAGNHYLVAYQAGAPDVAGTTVDTLQGT